MALRKPASRRRAVSMTSLIDVIFLLLLFFMLSSTFTKFAEIPLVSAGASGTARLDGPAPLFLRLGRDAIGLNGEPVEMAALAARIGAMEGEEKTVLVSIAGEDVTTQRLVDVLLELRRQPGLAVRVLE